MSDWEPGDFSVRAYQNGYRIGQGPPLRLECDHCGRHSAEKWCSDRCHRAAEPEAPGEDE